MKHTFNFIKRFHRLVVFFIDLFCIAASLYFSYYLRFNFQLDGFYYQQIEVMLPVLLLVKSVFSITFGLYNEIWSKVSLNAMRKIVFANIASFCVLLFLIYFIKIIQAVPRTVLIIDFFVCLCCIGGTRFSYRLFREPFRIRRTWQGGGKRALIIGSGFLGESLIREMKVDRHSYFYPVAMLDDNTSKIGRVLHDVPIVGRIEDLPNAVARYDIRIVIIAISALVGKELKRVLSLCEKAREQYGIEYRIVPGARSIIEGRVSVSQIREVNAEDLLGREPVEIDETKIGEFILDKSVLVTGAAGSIGSELVRQVLRHYPSRITVLDWAENSMFFLQQELNRRTFGAKTNTQINYIISDICNGRKLESVFERHRPDIVLHAAAYKHVPLMEMNPEEAISNNIISTQNIVKISEQSGVKNFVMVSTDKAVRPASMMGASKRIAEMIVQSHAGKSETVFSTVRFGNVINSSGSLVPLLMRQIRHGGPVTVTHPDIQRYFMTIPEAVRLILQAMVMSSGGEIFILDMGTPIKIYELAEDLIRLAGFTPHEQIEIVYTGLRPGEKMNEELWDDGEEPAPTAHPSIRRAVNVHHLNGFSDKKIEELLKAAKTCLRRDIVHKVRELIPGSQLHEEL
jgi:FlaA1/EpsC-like NDP-sugar epimerase